jgi:hypothetical protein
MIAYTVHEFLFQCVEICSPIFGRCGNEEEVELQGIPVRIFREMSTVELERLLHSFSNGLFRLD